MSEPQVHANNRILKQVRGKMLGGSRYIKNANHARTQIRKNSVLLNLFCFFLCCTIAP